MHSIWQEKIEFPEYPILKRDKKADVVYIGATLQNAVEAYFQHVQGKAVMILEEKVISQMPELGGMGILRAGNRSERKKPASIEKLYFQEADSVRDGGDIRRLHLDSSREVIFVYDKGN